MSDRSHAEEARHCRALADCADESEKPFLLSVAAAFERLANSERAPTLQGESQSCQGVRKPLAKERLSASLTSERV